MRMSDSARQGIFARLIDDHRQITAMMEQIEATAYDDAFDRESLFDELKKELLVHAHAEDTVVYRTLELYRSTAHLIRVSREEHALVEHLIDQLSALHDDDERWMARFQVLQDLLEHHIDEEEGDLFDLAADIVDRSQSEDLVDEFEDARRREHARQAGGGERRPQRDDRSLRDYDGREPGH